MSKIISDYLRAEIEARTNATIEVLSKRLEASLQERQAIRAENERLTAERDECLEELGKVIMACPMSPKYRTSPTSAGVRALRSAFEAAEAREAKAVEDMRKVTRAGGAMSNILYNLKQDPTLADALRERMGECQTAWDAALPTEVQNDA